MKAFLSEYDVTYIITNIRRFCKRGDGENKNHKKSEKISKKVLTIT